MAVDGSVYNHLGSGTWGWGGMVVGQGATKWITGWEHCYFSMQMWEKIKDLKQCTPDP